MANRNQVIIVRVEKILKDALIAEAKKQRRDFSDYIRLVLEDSICGVNFSSEPNSLLDLEKLEQKLDEALSKETKESLASFILSKRNKPKK